MANTITPARTWEELCKEYPELKEIKTPRELAQWEQSHPDVRLQSDALSLLENALPPRQTEKEKEIYSPTDPLPGVYQEETPPERDLRKKRLEQARTIVKNNILATHPLIDYGALAFNKKRQDDPKYQKKLSETQALWSNKYEYYDTKNKRVVPKTEFVQGGLGNENIVRRESPLWDRSLDNYTTEQIADKSYQEDFPNAKEEMLEEEKTKIYENPNDDPLLKETNKKAAAFIDISLSQAAEGKHFYTDALLLAKENDLQELYQESSRAYLRSFMEAFPEKAKAYTQYSLHNPDNYQLLLLRQEYMKREAQENANEIRSEENIIEETRPHDEVSKSSPFVYRSNPTTQSQPESQEYETSSTQRPVQQTRPQTSTNLSFPGGREEGSTIQNPAQEEDTTNTTQREQGEQEQAGARQKGRNGRFKKKKRKGLLPSNPLTSARSNIRMAAQIARTLFGGSALGISLAIIAAIVIYMVIFMGISPMGGGGGSSDNKNVPSQGGVGTTIKNPPIVGFSRSIEGPDASENGKNITYIIKYEYDSSVATTPLKNIVLIAKFSSNASFVDASGSYTSPSTGTIEWQLSDNKNSSPFTLTLQPSPDVYVTATIDQKASSGSSSSAGGNACTAPFEGTGYCTVDKLVSKFGDKGTALVASMICQAESTSDPFVKNLKCPPDYSVGLFQINQLAHCSSAFSSTSSCTIGDQSLLNACVSRFEDPTENINYAYQLYNSGGTGWTVNKWGAYAKVQKKLSDCGIL